MYIEDKFGSFPCELVINHADSHLFCYYNLDLERFVISEDVIDLTEEPFDAVPAPYYDDNPILLWQIFWSSLDEKDYAYFRQNYKGTQDIDEVIEFVENCYLSSKLYWAKKKLPMYLLENWERENELEIDWFCVAFA